MDCVTCYLTWWHRDIALSRILWLFCFLWNFFWKKQKTLNFRAHLYIYFISSISEMDETMNMQTNPSIFMWDHQFKSGSSIGNFRYGCTFKVKYIIFKTTFSYPVMYVSRESKSNKSHCRLYEHGLCNMFDIEPGIKNKPTTCFFSSNKDHTSSHLALCETNF